ncbi:uncharacterized protein LOC119867406 [Canis lupus familiaris]|uniref:uncharacterized protein LOC119867406 n=1 Tax=Canis lupus familiaris TaxID=9615 RepID=UPI0018F7D5A4|nr:uncharacterized protein LOC119867406 [Canis lupus familiaris]
MAGIQCLLNERTKQGLRKEEEGDMGVESEIPTWRNSQIEETKLITPGGKGVPDRARHSGTASRPYLSRASVHPSEGTNEAQRKHKAEETSPRRRRRCLPGRSLSPSAGRGSRSPPGAVARGQGQGGAGLRPASGRDPRTLNSTLVPTCGGGDGLSRSHQGTRRGRGRSWPGSPRKKGVTPNSSHHHPSGFWAPTWHQALCWREGRSGRSLPPSRLLRSVTAQYRAPGGGGVKQAYWKMDGRSRDCEHRAQGPACKLPSGET